MPAEPRPKPRTAPAEAPERRTIQPVNFHADDFNVQTVDGRRVVIARGNIYLSQGDPDSDLFLELRSQSAVVFLEKDVPEKTDVYSPFGPKLTGIKRTGEVVTGVYLEGDVVIARGERYFRGPAAFYDFTTDRAIVVDPVFRTVQKQRNIPLYIRAREARVLSAREMWFADARVTTSDFYTPTYHIGARSAYVMDTTPYDQDGKRLGEQGWSTKLEDVTFNIRGIPMLYIPVTRGNLEQGNTALRKAQFGKHGRLGWGVETQWHLFRLLGLVRPEGFKGRVELDWLERGGIAGLNMNYARKDFTGYHMLYGVLDKEGKDQFGTERDNIHAPGGRGRVLMRHKQFLRNDWQLQFELSYICDRNFLEEFFPDEFFAGKEQETLLYAKKQKDNWAFTSLLKGRLNRFQQQTESWPDLGLYLVGEPLAGDRLTFFHESHAGMKRFLLPNATRFGRRWRGSHPSPLDEYASNTFLRLDTRNEINLPLHAGPINIVPYATGRLTYWGDDWGDQTLPANVHAERLEGERRRLYGQIGVRANTHIWAVYDGVESRLWDVHRLKHIITPEVTTWLASAHGVTPRELFPMDPGIEGTGSLTRRGNLLFQGPERTGGVVFNVYQRLQTKRGPADDRRTVDWMRLNLSLGIYDNDHDNVPSVGRFFSYRPEYSQDRNHLNAEYAWNISDSTLLLADAYYDIDDQQFARGNIGLAVQRDPRLRYYAGVRYIDDADRAVGTFGVNYKINRKYSVSAFEQYDFAFEDGQNLSTSVTVTRKLPRWYAAFTFSYDNSSGEVTMLVTFWPEGISEVRLGGGKLSLLGRSDKN